jgi:hypothetical protein
MPCTTTEIERAGFEKFVGRPLDPEVRRRLVAIAAPHLAALMDEPQDAA